VPEVSADGRNRCFHLSWPGEQQLQSAWAEKYFDDHDEAFRYYERLHAENPTKHVHTPTHSHEDINVWAVCVGSDLE
jgi:hypothetical protein